jgi:diguanylate cyclase (GGDEF)-like protein
MSFGSRLLPLQAKWVALAIQNILIAFLFSVLFRISIDFASLPGKITAIWLPAGLTMAAVIGCGRRILPGILMGAFLIVVVELWGMMPLLSLKQVIGLSATFAICETLQPIIAAGWIQRFAKADAATGTALFNTVPKVVHFAIAAIAAPAIPALMGAASWSSTDMLSWSDFGLTWMTWWLPATMAHLIFTPPLLLGRRSPWRIAIARHPEGPMMAAITLGLLYLVFGLTYPVEYILLPVLIAWVFRLGLFPASLCLASITIVSIISTSHGQGPFVMNSPHQSFIFLQSFLAVLALTILVLSAILDEREASRNSLRQTLAFLEQKVAERSAQLYQSEAILSGFFSSAPVGMGILDKQLNFVRVNAVLANLNSSQKHELTDYKLSDLATDLCTAIRAGHHQVITTKQPLLNQEIESVRRDQSSEKQAWLLSYFPIKDADDAVSQVGLVLLEISDRKRLEATLRQQVHRDSLTQIANRRCFDKHLNLQWYQCMRSQQPLSLILCDVDDFKAYNDCYGHPQGDRCLVQVAQMINQRARRMSDLAFRYGGEEFGLLLPNTSPAAAKNIALSIQADLRSLRIRHEASQVADFVTLSIGAVTCVPQATGFAAKLVEATDQALYRAKHLGKDQVVVGRWNAENLSFPQS